MNPRNGKIARLPREIRDELNERLERSDETSKLLDWLNALPEAKEVVQNDFAGVPISKQNLSEWRQGGFQEWLVRRDLCEEARDLTQLADDMVGEYAGGILADDVATVLAARFGSLIAKWDGEVDEKFEAKTRVLNRLCRSVVQLQRGMHRANRESLEVARMIEEKEERENQELKKKLTAPFFNTLKAGRMAALFGGGTAGRKIAEYILAVRSGRLDAELDVLSTDQFNKPEPVKPVRKRRTAKRARKTKSANMDKPLQKKEMDNENEEESIEDSSESVKPNQTDLAPADDSPTPEDHPKTKNLQISPISPISPMSLMSPNSRPPLHQSPALPTFVPCQGSAARERLWAVPRRSGAWNGAKWES
jgi:hypothetical protein